MLYEDNAIKTCCILNAKASVPGAFNGALHALLGLTGRIEAGELSLLDYPFAQRSYTSLISHYPVIVLQAKNSSQLRRAALDASEAGLATNMFAATMLGESARQQQAQTAAAAFEEAEMIALALFGPAERMQAITRKFSLFKAPSPMEVSHGA